MSLSKGRDMSSLDALKIKLFCDAADYVEMVKMAQNPVIKGFTTNPSLMRKAGVASYEEFAREALAAIPDRPISFEVFADDFDEMEQQARKITSWGPNVNVKIPITNTAREFTGPLIHRLSASGIVVNVTAMMTLDQVCRVADALDPGTPAIISVFAGRIADTGVDPVPVMAEAVEVLRPLPKAELLWASPRELLNILQADAIGCHIITATPDVLGKLKLLGKNLDEYSLETVMQFYQDAKSAGYHIS
jgi:transaldolase